jgi:hypothetical protein
MPDSGVSSFSRNPVNHRSRMSSLTGSGRLFQPALNPGRIAGNIAFLLSFYWPRTDTDKLIPISRGWRLALNRLSCLVDTLPTFTPHSGMTVFVRPGCPEEGEALSQGPAEHKVRVSLCGSVAN